MARQRSVRKDQNLFLDDDQLTKLFKAIRQKRGYETYDWELIFQLILYFGLRVSELASLKTVDVHISKNISESTITIRAKKRGHVRTYDCLDSKMTKRLSKWIENGRSKLANNKNEYMFPSRERALFDRHITEASIKTRFYNYCRDAGLPSYYSVHHLRSSSAILWAKRGKSPIEIMRWLRLKSLICAKRYFDRHEFKEMNSEAHDVFEKYL